MDQVEITNASWERFGKDIHITVMVSDYLASEWLQY